MWARIALVLALSAGPALAEPLFQTRAGKVWVSPPPGTPTYTYELRYAADAPWPGDREVRGALEWRGAPEPVTITVVDGPSRTVRIVTTARGRESFNTVPAVITRLEPLRPGPVCSEVYATLRLTEAPEGGDKVTTRSGAACPFADQVDVNRELIVEGLDRRGKRLFSVVSDDPRWTISETFTPDGRIHMEGMGRTPAPWIHVKFRAPLGGGLAKLRVWQLDRQADPRVIGEIAWRNVTARP